MLSDYIDKMEITTQVYIDALIQVEKSKKDHWLYIWNVTPNSYDYVISDANDAMPDIVGELYVQREFIYKEKPHE